jgi:acylphosphatase
MAESGGIVPAGRRLRVFGRIQGVGFRYWAYKQALRLGIRGWIRNEKDGTVTVECQGPESAVAAFIACLRKGPPQARVDKIDITETLSPRAYRQFEITY